MQCFIKYFTCIQTVTLRSYLQGGPPGHLPGNPEQWKGLAGQPPVVYPFDPMLAVHPYASL